MNTRKLTETALLTAVIAVLAPLSIPLAGQIPISLATFAVMLAGELLGAKQGGICAALYLLLGAIGVPVFAGYTGGAAILFGVTGGFLFGYIPLAIICGLFAERMKKDGIPSLKGMLIGMVLGTVVLYALGLIWFMIFTKMGIGASLAACVLPFLPGDALKIAAVCLLVPRLYPFVSKNLH